MQRNATPSADALTPNQDKALAALLAGKSVTDAAAAAEVDRTTVHRWLKDDFGFRAAFNRERHRLREAMQSRLMTLAEKAMECVERSIADGDGKAALALLKGLGLLPGEPPNIGSEDPADLAADARRQELFRSCV